MTVTRISNAKKNIISGLIQKIITILLPFINRTAILWVLGAEYQGLSSLFTSVLSVLNIAELGISSAIVYSMYKPISDKNIDKINMILNYFKKMYLVIGIIIAVVGLSILPILPKLINGNAEIQINIYILYLLYLFNSVSSYFFFSYKSVILNAYQKSNIINNVMSIIKIIECLLQFFILIVFKNYYIYIAILPIFTTILNLIISKIVDKKYPFHKPIGKIGKSEKKEIKKQISGLMINKIADVARNSFDSIIISMFLGLIVVAQYSNYYYIYSSLYAIMLIITNSLSAIVGDSIAKESKEKNHNDFMRLNFIFMWITGWCTICLIYLYQPFMKLWVGEQMLIEETNMICFAIYFYTINMNNIRNIYFSGNGLWWKAKKIFIIEAVSNLILNFILGYLFGIFGILISTIITIVLFNFVGRTKILYKFYFAEYDIKKLFKKHISMIVVTCINILICGVILNNIKIERILSNHN